MAIELVLDTTELLERLEEITELLNRLEETLERLDETLDETAIEDEERELDTALLAIVA